MKPKKIVRAFMVAGLMAASALVNAQEATRSQMPTIVVTRIQNDGQKPINRLEGTGKLTYNSDYYGTAEEQGDAYFFKIRLQFVPLSYNTFGLGTSIQHKDGNMLSEQTDWGFVARLQGKLNNTTSGKLDLRYFPSNETFDWYGFVDYKNVLLDVLGDYNAGTNRGFIRPGIDAKFGTSFSLGLEAKFAGAPSDLENKYVGMRFKLRY